jgi:hypothetical protein
MARYDSAPDPVRPSLRVSIAKLLSEADEEFDAIGDRISVRRDWLDAHRKDDPPHASYKKRRKHFYEIDSREHAEAGELLERGYEAITATDRKAA